MNLFTENYKNKPILWKNSPESGIGDRLMTIMVVFTFCRKIKSPLYVHWRPRIRQDIEPEFRDEDIILNNMLTMMKFPVDLNIIDTNSEYPVNINIINECLFFQQDYCGFYLGYSDDIFSSCEEFRKEAHLVAKDFKFIEKRKVPKDLISIHIRRTDKVRDRGSSFDTHMVAYDELEKLDKLTFDWIDKLSETYKTFYVAGDDLGYISKYKKYIDSKGLNVYNPKTTDGCKKTYQDLQIMSRSSIILQSQRYSSFSVLASLIGSNRLINVYSEENL